MVGVDFQPDPADIIYVIALERKCLGRFTVLIKHVHGNLEIEGSRRLEGARQVGRHRHFKFSDAASRIVRAKVHLESVVLPNNG